MTLIERRRIGDCTVAGAQVMDIVNHVQTSAGNSAAMRKAVRPRRKHEQEQLALPP